MWADGMRQLASLDPMRWSAGRTPEEVVSELEQLAMAAHDAARPVELCFTGRGLRFEGPEAAAQWIREALLLEQAGPPATGSAAPAPMPAGPGPMRRASKEGSPMKGMGDKLQFSDFMTGFFRLLWPKMAMAASANLKEALDVALSNALQAMPAALRAEVRHAVTCQSLKLGESAPEILEVFSYKRHRKLEDGVEICGRLRWDATVDIELDFGPLRLRIDRITLDGVGALVCKPLLDREPVIGGFQIFFCSQPELHVGLAGLGGITSWSLVDAKLRRLIDEAFKDMLVLPNRFIQKFASTRLADVPDFRCPPPAGLLRVHVLAARDLAGADLTVVGPATSDPYCVVRLGRCEGRTRTVHRTCSPVWGEQDAPLDVLVYHERQVLQLDVIDANVLRADEPLAALSKRGSASGVAVLLARQAEAELGGETGIWLPLEPAGEPKEGGKGGGVINLRLQYLDLRPAEVPDDRPAAKVQPPPGDEPVLLSLRLYYMKGMKPEHSKGAQVKFRVGGKEVLSRKCVALMPGYACGFGSQTCKSIQRLDESGVPPEVISKAFDLKVEAVEEVVRAGKRESTWFGFDQALHLISSRPEDRWLQLGGTLKASELAGRVTGTTGEAEFLVVRGYTGAATVGVAWRVSRSQPLTASEAVELLTDGPVDAFTGRSPATASTCTPRKRSTSSTPASNTGGGPGGGPCEAPPGMQALSEVLANVEVGGERIGWADHVDSRVLNSGA